MKLLYSYLIFCCSYSVMNAQTVNGTVIISENADVAWVIEKFNHDQHTIEYCESDFSENFVCKIDGEIWYGSDMGMEMPRNILRRLTLTIDSKIVALDVSNMFNPSYDGHLASQQFKLEKQGAYYMLYSFFSDGAGSYTVHWKILGNASIREVISNDESYFEWQNN